MNNTEDKMDITKNIKIIEMLKCQILNCVADFHSSMIKTGNDFDEKYDILADLIILSFILGNRTGIGYETLELKIKKKLKLGVLEDDDNLHNDVVELLRYFNGK